MDIPEDIPERCTALSALLGNAQPIDSLAYGFLPGTTTSSRGESKSNVWSLPRGCFASVPPFARTAAGSVQIKLRWSGTSDSTWPTEIYAPAQLEHGDVSYYLVSASSKTTARVRIFL